MKEYKVIIQIPHTRYGVITIETMTTELQETLEKAKSLIKTHRLVEEEVRQQRLDKKWTFTEKQKTLVKVNGGDVNKEFNTIEEVNAYIDNLLANKSIKSAPKTYNQPQTNQQPSNVEPTNVPWDETFEL